MAAPAIRVPMPFVKPSPGPLEAASLETIFLYVNDFPKMRQFYHETLGLPIGYENPNYADFKTNGARIAIHTGRGTVRRRESHWFMEFRVRGIDGVVARLRRKGVRCSRVRKESFGRISSFLDPEGNLIGLEEAPS